MSKMFSINFPDYCRLDALNSLVTKSVHVLCTPISSLRHSKSQSLSSLYDPNLFDVHNQRANNTSAPSRLVEVLLEEFRQSNRFLDGTQHSLLDINSRQAIVDYIIRERIVVTANFVILLMQDGGVYNFDLWQLCEINEFSCQEVEQILHQMCLYANGFRSLCIGGASWIYNFCVINGPLKRLFCKNVLSSLRALKIQQSCFEIDLVSMLQSCPNLERLEIAQPSLTNRDILKMAAYLANNKLSICQSLRYITLPSSVKEEGIMHFLAHFPNITHLRCTPFEQLIDLLDHSQASLSPTQDIAQKTLIALGNILALSIAHPMSCDVVERLLVLCPKLEELSLELQEGMNLSKLATHASSLRKLELHNSPTMPIEFSDYVVPILEGCGKHLRVLSLEHFDHIDLTAVAQHCPNLCTFSAQWFSVVTVQTRMLRLFQIRSPFSGLRHLRLRPRPHHSLPVEVVSLMMRDAAHLRHVELYCCSELTDESIYEIHQSNSLSQLQTFIMRHGHSVTNDALCKLVLTASSSSNLVFHDCGLVPPSLKEEL